MFPTNVEWKSAAGTVSEEIDAFRPLREDWISQFRVMILIRDPLEIEQGKERR